LGVGFQAHVRDAEGRMVEQEEIIPNDIDRWFIVTAYGPGVQPVEFSDRLGTFFELYKDKTFAVVYFNGVNHFSRCPLDTTAKVGETKQQ